MGFVNEIYTDGNGEYLMVLFETIRVPSGSTDFVYYWLSDKSIVYTMDAKKFKSKYNHFDPYGTINV